MEASSTTDLPADEDLIAPDVYGFIVINGGALIRQRQVCLMVNISVIFSAQESLMT